MPRERKRDRLSFIHVSHPDSFRNKDLQKRIRRHVMGTVGESRLKLRRNPTISVHIPSDMTDRTIQSQQGLLGPLQQRIPPHLPFLGIHPLETDPEVRRLVHFMQVAGNLRHIPFRYEWYSMATTDPTAFYLYLANAALLHGQVTEQDNSSESAKYLGICLTQVVERLGKETARVSPGLMLTILGLACHDTHSGYWDRRALHLDGLERAVRLHGGLEGLDHKLSLFIFWFDILDSSLRGSIPRYPVPRHLLEETNSQGTISPALENIIERMKQCAGDREISDTLKKLGSLVNFLSHISYENGLWENSVWAASVLTPISHCLLSMPRIMDHLDGIAAGDYLVELARVALLIVLARLNQVFLFPSDELLFLQQRFRQLFLRHSGSGLPDLELWCVASVALVDHANMQAYARPINDLAERLGIRGSARIVETVRHIMFVDRILSLDIKAFTSSLDKAQTNPVNIPC